MPRTKAPVVECMECKLLPYFDPTLGHGVKPGDEWRPATPRKIDKRSGPRSPRCHTHFERKKKAAARREQELRRERVYDMPAELFEEIKEEQGGFCPCGNKIKHIDHYHHMPCSIPHPPELGCEECWRGLLCHTCNSDILGRGYTVARLLAIVDYLLDPPAPRVMRRVWQREAAS